MVHLLKANKKKDSETYANRNTDYIYKSDLDKDCFHYDMAYGKFKTLNKSDKVLRDKAFEIVSNRKYDGQQRGLVSIIYKFCDKKCTGIGIKNKIKQNQQPPNELEKPIMGRC